ncbi:MAG TPA: hypothetical protein VF170_12310 [Planctomycetaceae bacterium]
MRTNPTGRRLALCGLTALAGLLLAASARPAAADEGVARLSDRKTGVVPASHTDACAPACAPDACGEGAACRCGSGCKCGGKSGLLGRFFGKGKDCRCGSGCRCGKGSGLIRCSGHCNGKCDLNGDGYADSIGHGVCKGCGSHGELFGHGYCGSCCGFAHCCLPGIPCLGFPCLGVPVPGCCAAHGGAIGGTYARVYALNPYYHDFRDGAVYAAQGYNAPIAVPLAPNVDYQWNYGWGIPPSRITPISRVVPSPYAVQPQYAVPPGYVPAGAVPPAPQNGEAETEDGEN